MNTIWGFRASIVCRSFARLVFFLARHFPLLSLPYKWKTVFAKSIPSTLTFICESPQIVGFVTSILLLYGIWGGFIPLGPNGDEPRNFSASSQTYDRTYSLKRSWKRFSTIVFFSRTCWHHFHGSASTCCAIDQTCSRHFFLLPQFLVCLVGMDCTWWMRNR